MADKEGNVQTMEMDSKPPQAEENIDPPSLKKQGQEDDVIKENGIKMDVDSTEEVTNGPKKQSDEKTPEATQDTKSDQESTVEPTANMKEENNGESPEEGNSESEEANKESTEALKQEQADANESETSNARNEPDAEMENDETSKEPSEANGNDEVMDVDEDSNAVGSNSNLSAPISIDEDSKQASIMSEDNSRDSVGSVKSTSDADSNQKDGIVSKVKDEEGTDIVITLNDTDKNDGETDADDSQGAESSKTSTKDRSKVPSFDLSKKSTDKNSSSALRKADSTPKQNNSMANTIIPANAKIVRQGDKVGYLTRVGNQNVMVPLSSTTVTQGNSNSSAKVGKQHTPTGPPIKPEDLKPKSSLDMIELMRWELYNRVPDNFNWSVAFHPKKEELSAITSFLLELGHDVVKEAVYKDIIQIQTKKKENGDLKDNEIESLEKMKTVYDNTKKKVEHLFLDTQSCNSCKFKTESSVVLDFHKDFPHFEPPWDAHKGMMKCSYCKYTTRVGLQFVLHMESIHKIHAKFPEKEHTFNCELCPLSTSTKNKLEKHRQKCEKHFKLGSNLQPYFHDVNFSMKNMYYKPKKPAITKSSSPATPQAAGNLPKPPPPRTPIAPAPSPQRPIVPQQQTPTTPQTRNLRGNTPVVHPPIPKLQPPPKSPFQSLPPAKFRTAAANMPNFPPKQNVPANRGGRHTTNKEMQGFEVCELCGGYVKDRQALRIHFYYAHKVEMPQAIFTRPTPPLICDVCQSKFWTTQGLSKHKSSLRHFSSTGPTPAAFGTNQMCFMCMKKVPNLFSHVEQVHGMSMKDLVVMKKCIMCGVTANDKRSLESHLATAHGILMKATDLLGSNEKAPAPVRAQNSPQPQQQPTTPKTAKSSNLARQNLCVFCQIQFADNIQLTMHCIKVHATCNGCGMVVASTKHLMYHSCKVMKRKCIICGLKNIAPEVYAMHVKSHVKPCNVQVDKLSSEEIEGVKEKIKKEYKPQIISLDSDEDSEVEIFDKDAKPDDSDEKSEKDGDIAKEKSANDESHDNKMTNGDIKPGASNGDDEVDKSCESKSDENEANESVEKDEETDLISKDKVKPECNESKDTNEVESVEENHKVSQEQNRDLDDSLKTENIDNSMEHSSVDNSETNGQEENRKRKLTENDEQSEESGMDSKRVKVDEDSNAGCNIGANPETDSNSNIDM